LRFVIKLILFSFIIKYLPRNLYNKQFMDNEHYISPQKITKQFDVTSGTLRRWAEDGKIRYLRPGNGKRIYNIQDIAKHFGVIPKQQEHYTVCYARVSSNHQKQDLQRQIDLLREQYPEARIIKDIGSGLNWNRPGFRTLLELVNKGDVSEVVVTYRDRMCRFAFELVEWIFKKSNVKLVVLNNSTNQPTDFARDLSDDLLAITTVFVAKNNGLRAAEYKKQRRNTKTEKSNTTIEESTKNNSKTTDGNS
jgi:putative resolvase